MIEHLKITGFTKYDVLTAASRQWDVSRSMRKCFDTYFILHWSSSFVKHNLRNGTIKKDGITYNVVYAKGFTPTQLHEDIQVRLSFRKPIKEFQIPGFVLIAPVRD